MTNITLPEGLIRPEVELTGTDGNAMMIMGNARRALRRAGNSSAVIDAYTAEATSGDYDHVLATTCAYCEVW